MVVFSYRLAYSYLPEILIYNQPTGHSLYLEPRSFIPVQVQRTRSKTRHKQKLDKQTREYNQGTWSHAATSKVEIHKRKGSSRPAVSGRHRCAWNFSSKPHQPSDCSISKTGEAATRIKVMQSSILTCKAEDMSLANDATLT
jgi:hypothetical protein